MSGSRVLSSVSGTLASLCHALPYDGLLLYCRWQARDVSNPQALSYPNVLRYPRLE
jgi:hypothetical protein